MPQIVKNKGIPYDIVFTKLESAEYLGEVFYPVKYPRYYPRYDVYRDGGKNYIRVDLYSRSGNLYRRGTSQADEEVEYVSANYIRIGGDTLPARVENARIVVGGQVGQAGPGENVLYIDLSHLSTYITCDFELLPDNVIFIRSALWSYLYQVVFVPSDSVLHNGCVVCNAVSSIRIIRDCGHAVCSGTCYTAYCAACDEEYQSLSE